MKRLLILLLVIPLLSVAKTSKETPVYFRFGYLHTSLLGNTHAFRNNNFFYGQGYNGHGVNMSLAIPLKKNWYVGFNYEPTSILILTDRVASQAYTIFDDAQHYTRINKYNITNEIGIHQLSLEVAGLFKTKYVELMPTVKSGVLIYGGSDDIMNYSRKRLNSNYTDEVRVLRSNSPTTVFWSVGLRVNKRLSKIFGFTGGVFYTGAPDLNVGYITKTTDFLGHSWQSAPVRYTQSFQAFQFQLGATFYTWKGRRKRNVKAVDN
ncbi:MAG: hypothetical protein R2800_05175 [Flavipsychrobacter sp.]